MASNIPSDRSEASPIPHPPSISTEVPKHKICAITKQLLINSKIQASFQDDLNKSLHKSVSLAERIRNNFGLVARINSLSQDVLNYKISASEARIEIDRIIDELDQVPSLSPGQEKAIAELSQSYQKIITQPYLQTRLNQLNMLGKPLTRENALKIINQHNLVSDPHPELAGTLAIEREGIKIYYDEKGKLTLGAPGKKTVTPVVRNPGVLDAGKIQMAENCYHEITDNARYNNLGPMLEFMQFFSECRKVNQNISLREAFEAFQAHPRDIYKKYKSGDCVILSGALQDRLEAEGLTSAIVGQYTGPAWSRLPANLNRNPPWDEYDACTENVHHCMVVSRYQDERQIERGIAFPFFELQNNVDIKKWEAMEDELMGNSKDTKGNITNPDTILKMQMRGKTKMVYSGKDKSLMGVDLLQGNIYFNTAAINGIEGLPLNASNRVSINLTELMNPDEIGTYYIDHKPVLMTHREALLLVIEKTNDRFDFPPDFVENLITLAQQTDNLFTEILLDPSSTVRETYREIQAVQEMEAKAEDKSRKYQKMKNLPHETILLIKEYQEQLALMNSHVDRMLEAIKENQPKTVRNIAQIIGSINERLVNLSAIIENVPAGVVA